MSDNLYDVTVLTNKFLHEQVLLVRNVHIVNKIFLCAKPFSDDFKKKHVFAMD